MIIKNEKNTHDFMKRGLSEKGWQEDEIFHNDFDIRFLTFWIYKVLK